MTVQPEINYELRITNYENNVSNPFRLRFWGEGQSPTADHFAPASVSNAFRLRFWGEELHYNSLVVKG